MVYFLTYGAYLNSKIMTCYSSKQVSNGFFTLNLDVDEVYTITTVTSGNKGLHPDPPASAPFPNNYSDDFKVRKFGFYHYKGFQWTILKVG